MYITQRKLTVGTPLKSVLLILTFFYLHFTRISDLLVLISYTAYYKTIILKTDVQHFSHILLYFYLKLNKSYESIYKIEMTL